MFLVAPTEPKEIAVLGTVSSVPERLGCDVIWAGRKGLSGVQRKTVSDLIASVRDGRLGKELEQMERLSFRGLIIEGSPSWTRDGELLGGFSRWSIKQHRGVMMSAQSKGIVTVTSRDHLDTLATIEHMVEWSNKDETSSSMLYRGNGRGDEWGQLTDRATAIHFLSGCPGIGVELAKRIYDQFGKVPIQWSVTQEELSTVKGLGKKRVEQLWRVLNS